MRLRYLCAVALWVCLPLNAAKSYNFSVPLSALQDWTKDAVVQVEARVAGHSGVHRVQNDCEMHFGGTVAGYDATPAGWVFEPMNVCIQPFFGKDEQRNADWLAYGDRIVQKGQVKITGVPRIWPEHLAGGNEDSNPNHAMEIHPITLIDDGDTPHDFSSFIFAPEGLAGISDHTQDSILRTTTVIAKRSGGLVQIVMKTGGLIGNFATLAVSISPGTIQAFPGGHRMEGEAEFEGGDSFPVRMVSVKGSPLDEKMAAKGGAASDIRLEVLVLFSLSPTALLEAAQPGGNGKVKKPIQLILYGETDLPE